MEHMPQRIVTPDGVIYVQLTERTPDGNEKCRVLDLTEAEYEQARTDWSAQSWRQVDAAMDQAPTDSHPASGG
jgi:hypothetical protein